MARRVLLLLAACAAVSVRAHGGLPVNPRLGVPGFPDCVQPAPVRAGMCWAGRPPGRLMHRVCFAQFDAMDVEANALTLQCRQQGSHHTHLTVACVGDSITAGAFSSDAK